MVSPVGLGLEGKVGNKIIQAYFIGYVIANITFQAHPPGVHHLGVTFWAGMIHDTGFQA